MLEKKKTKERSENELRSKVQELLRNQAKQSNIAADISKNSKNLSEIETKIKANHADIDNLEKPIKKDKKE